MRLTFTALAAAATIAVATAAVPSTASAQCRGPACAGPWLTGTETWSAIHVRASSARNRPRISDFDRPARTSRPVFLRLRILHRAFSYDQISCHSCDRRWPGLNGGYLSEVNARGAGRPLQANRDDGKG